MSTSRFKQLDGLRGIAAFIVVIEHLFLVFYPAAVMGPPSNKFLHMYGTVLYLLVNGSLAVSVFFVMSAFVLSVKFFSTGSPETCPAGAIKRFPRLAIPVCGSIVLAYLLMKLGWFHNAEIAAIGGYEAFKTFWTPTPKFWDMIQEALFLGVVRQNHMYNPPLWTIPFELYGSMFLFAGLALFGKLKNRAVIYALLTLLSWKTNYFAFVVGVAICDLYHNHRDAFMRIGSKWSWLMLALAIAFGCFPIASTAGTWYEHIIIPSTSDFETRSFLQALSAAGIVIALLSNQKIGRFFACPPLAFLGKISFSVYLVHYLILGSFSSALFLALMPKLSYSACFAVTSAASIAVVVLVSTIYERYVDSFALKFSSKLNRKWFSESDARTNMSDQVTSTKTRELVSTASRD